MTDCNDLDLFSEHPIFQGASQKCSSAPQPRPASPRYPTFEPRDAGPRWQYRPFRHWLVLHDDSGDDALAGIACALLARNACIGKCPCTAIPGYLQARHRRLCDVLAAGLRGGEA